MNSIHQQAMTYVYKQVLQRLLSYLARPERAALQLLCQRLIVAAGGLDRMADYKVLLAHGGGKDSSYTLALLRAAQLSIAARSPATFVLRVATLRHPGVTSVVMSNIQRGYSALFLHDDPRVELLMIDHDQVQPFSHQSAIDVASRDRHRRTLLINAHLTAGDGRSSFCNHCYLTMSDLYLRASRWEGGVDLLVSGDSVREQKRYLAWLSRVARTPGEPRRARVMDLASFGQTCAQLRHDYQRQLGDPEAVPIAAQPAAVRPTLFMGLHDLIGVPLELRWSLLQEFLGFRFDDLSFHFSESDCANPLLMAHLRGLQAEQVRGLSYAVGIGEYLQLAEALMRKKRMPAFLIEQALSAYDSAQKINARRSLANAYAQDAFGLNEHSLVCLLFSPFVDRGKGLESYLRQVHPGMLVALAELHRALMAQSASEQAIRWLTRISGLSLLSLQSLYRMQRVNFNDPDNLIARMRCSDPDKHRVTVIDCATGDSAKVLLSGR